MNMTHPTRSTISQKRYRECYRNRLARVLALILISLNVAIAGDAPSLEYQVKGACLIKFGMFVEWPAATNASTDKSPFLIGILGDDPFGKAFDDAVAKEKVNGRQVVVKRSKAVAELRDCQIVFIAGLESDRLSAALTEFSTNGVLTVSDTPGFARNGGVVGFFKDAGKVRFEINTEIAGQSGLKVSSKLLQVGRVVPSGKPDHG